MTLLRVLLSVVISASLWTMTFSAARRAPTDTRPVPTPHRAESRRSPPTVTDLDKRAADLRAHFGPKGFTVIVEPPFVVLGDEPTQSVESHAVYAVRWAVNHLKSEFFSAEPNELIEIWLFKDDQSYRSHAKEIFGDDPDTPFGYYSPTHKALIMNISTGRGTLVHEIVHPFVRAVYPTCPAWLNEGLASLFEQSAERDGKIVGLVNWRLKGLKREINAGRLPSFKDVFSLANDAFYAEKRGDNYAQSRYLLYFLQEKGLLHAYWKSCLENRKSDPTGIETLKSVLKQQDLDAFQKEWQRWVLALRK